MLELLCPILMYYPGSLLERVRNCTDKQESR